MSHLFAPIQTAELLWQDNIPYSVLYDDVYYSAAGGLAQSKHVFIDGNHLLTRWAALDSQKRAFFNIGETGFGTGLNFLNTWNLWEQYAPSSASLHFISCDKHPLSRADLIKSLKNWPELATKAQQLIDAYPILTPGYHHLQFCDGRVRLTLMLGDALEQFEQLLVCGDSILESGLRSAFIDAWYLDGFSPKRNEVMWSEPLLLTIAMLSKKSTTLATYTAAGSIKSGLRKAGFIVEKIEGFGPKRHMLCAVFAGDLEYKSKTRQTPWHTTKINPQSNRSAIIVGAGLSGCFTAYFLAQRGWTVTILDELNEAGRGGSANQRAVLFPKLSPYQSPLTQLMLSAFIYATQFYKNEYLPLNPGDLSGALLLAYNDQEKRAQEHINEWFSHYPDLGQLVSQEEASILAGLPLKHPGLFIPLSGWINSFALCQFLISGKNISLVPNHTVSSLFFDNDLWHIDKLSAPVLILANGPQANTFKQTAHLPLKSIRGQMTVIKKSPKSKSLKIPVCAQGHVLPQSNGVHYLGATYELGVASSQIKSEDDEKNKMKLNQISAPEFWSDDVVDHWAGIRASTPDYLPLVGQLPDAAEFIKQFDLLKTNSKRWMAKSGPFYQGLYICAGFGSRGITSIPLCAQWLASLINQEISCLPRHLIRALSPARFLYRSIIRTNPKELKK